MKSRSFAFLPALTLLCCALSAKAQSVIPQPVAPQSLVPQFVVPKSIQFNGDSDYTNAEFLVASGLALGEELNTTRLNESTQRLLNTGLFEDIRFAYNDDLVAFQIIPAAAYPIRLENFPINFGGDLEARLHARIPLYRGKVPASGALLNEVTQELREELAAMKIAATVSPSLYSDGIPAKISAINFSITSPDVSIGEIQLGVLSGTMVAKVRAMAAGLTGSPFSSSSSAQQVEASITSLYRDQGYLEAKVQATVKPKPVIDTKGVHIPYSLSIEEGPQYKLSAVQLAPGLLVPQAVFNRLRGQQPGDIASPTKLRQSCEFITREYRKKGFLKAQIIPTPAFDRTLGTVSYLITAQPGPQYTMGALKIENVDDQMRDKIAAALTMPQGAPFNEAAIIGMTGTHNVNPDVEHFFATQSLFYKLNLNDDAHTVDVDLTPQKRP